MSVVAVHPCTKISAVLLAAGVVVATPSIVSSPHQVPPVLSSVAVRPASVITNTLDSLGDLADVGIEAVVLPVDALTLLPLYTIAAAAEALQKPSLIPTLLSGLVQMYTNPGVAGYPEEFISSVFGGLANLFPYPLGPKSVGTATGLLWSDLTGTEITIGKLFSGLADPTAGDQAMGNFISKTVPGELLAAISLLIPSVAGVAAESLSWLGHLPGLLEATAESAIRNPAQIPGLLSNLVHSALGSTGLLAGVAYELAAPLTSLPAPVGTWVSNVVKGFISGVTTILNKLFPVPVTPKPFAAVVVPPKSAAAAPVTAAVMPQPALKTAATPKPVATAAVTVHLGLLAGTTKTPVAAAVSVTTADSSTPGKSHAKALGQPSASAFLPLATDHGGKHHK